MKNKRKEKKQINTNYSQLKVKLILYLLGLLAISFGIVFLLEIIFQKASISNWLISVIQQQFHLNAMEASNLYTNLFYTYFGIIQIILTIALFVGLLCITMRRFTKYFDIIGQMIDILPDEKTPISLPSEISLLEYKLNHTRQAFHQAFQLHSLEVKDAEQRKNDLVMYLAHDIRTPLTSIIGYLSLLEETPDMPVENRAKYIHITMDKASHLEKMVNEFFEITRYNIQQIVPDKVNIDLYYMLVQLLDELSGLLASHGNTAVLKAKEDLTVYADPEKLARVFNNILKNAMTYSDRNTEIIVSAKEQDEKIFIYFQNKGDTIPKEKLSKIFEKFYRLDEARTSNLGGSGLGLAIAQEIVRAHGGAISVVSENNVTTFGVMLPAR